MSYSVTVHLENGRRQRVPVKLNTPILVIVEEVCKQQKLKSNDYDLKYHNRILDTTSTIQFCSVTNNAQLELVPATKSRTESEVTIFLQLESGERLSGSFLPSNSLRDVIDKLCNDDIKSRENPVIIYTRQEVSGDRLKGTTLKMFGLTGGNALLRLLHRSEDQLRNQSSSCTYNLPSKPKKEESKRRMPKEVSLKDLEDKTPKIDEKKLEFKDESSDSIIPSTSAAINTVKTVSSSSNIDLTTTPGTSSTKTEIEKINLHDPPKVKIPQTVVPFNLNDVKFIGERYALIFRTDDIRSFKFEEQADDFYEVTIDDAKTLLRDIRRTRSELEEAQLETFESKARKQSQMFKRTVSVYPHCVVRILFPNRLALQGVFVSTETVLDVTDFVKNYLEIPILDFYLYLAPPKTIVAMNKALIEVGGVPAINFYFGGQYVDENPNGLFLRERFIQEATHAEVAFKVANYFRQRSNVDDSPEALELRLSPVATELEDHRNELCPTPTQFPTTRNNDRKPSSSFSGRVPRWFKPQ